MAALSLLISSRILQDGTAICLILCDLCYVLVYLSLPCHISSGVLFPDTDVLKTLRPFRVYFVYKFDPRLSSLRSSQTPGGPIRKRTCSCCLCGTRWSFSLPISLLLTLCSLTQETLLFIDSSSQTCCRVSRRTR